MQKANTLFVHTFCFAHQFHLVALKTLKQAGHYFNNLAKVVNVWRSPGTPTKLFKAWEETYGRQRATEVLKRLPARASRGRWGSTDKVEHFMEVATPRETQAVWKQVFAGNLNILPAITETAEQAQDILIDEESKDYTKRMNRWQRGSTAAILSTDFWLQLYTQRS